MMEKVGRNLSLIALVTLLAVLPFENRFAAIYQIAEASILAGILLRLGAQSPRRLWFAAVGVFVVSMLVFLGIAWIYLGATQSMFTFAEVAKALLKEISALYFCMTAVFLGQFFFRPESWKPLERWTKISFVLVWVFSLIVLLSAVCSVEPLDSLANVRKYMIPYLLVYVTAVESFSSWRHYRIAITAVYLAGIIVTSASVTARYMYVHGGLDLKHEFLQSEIVRQETTTEGRTELRIQWPFGHHNRLCSYAIIVTMFVWLQFFVTRNWELKTLVAISAVIPIWCAILTLTRGGWIALATGALALILMINWRSVWILLAVVLAAWLVSPPVVRDRLNSVFRLSTYTQESGTLYLRKHLWAWAIDIARQHPVLGLGAGWERYEEYVKKTYPLPVPNMETSNAHNNFLEIAAESGIPAALVFLAFTATLVVQISRAWRVTERQTKRRFVVAGFFALFITITVYGLGSYSLRERVGMLVWICFALMTLLPIIARAIPEESEPAPAPAADAPPGVS